MDRRSFLALGTSVTIAGCSSTLNSDGSEDPTENDYDSPNDKPTREFDRTVEIDTEEVYAKDYDLLDIPYTERPQWFSNPYQYPSDPPDPESIRDWPNSSMAEIQGQTGHHPLRTTRNLGRLSDYYRITGDEAYLQKGKQIRDELINNHSTILDDSLYFNYGFDHQLFTSHVRKAPWFSGMAQGTGLSAFTSWYEVTGDESWLVDAERTYRSLSNTKENRSDPYVTYAESKYLWLAEYPEPDGSIKVLNGFVIGLWGPFEYWLVTGSDDAKKLVQAYLTTLEEHAMDWRNRGKISNYDLTTGNAVPEHYHPLHIFQFRQLAKYSKEEYFTQVSHAYLQDRPDLDYARCENLHCN